MAALSAASLPPVKPRPGPQRYGARFGEARIGRAKNQNSEKGVAALQPTNSPSAAHEAINASLGFAAGPRPLFSASEATPKFFENLKKEWHLI